MIVSFDAICDATRRGDSHCSCLYGNGALVHCPAHIDPKPSLLVHELLERRRKQDGPAPDDLASTRRPAGGTRRCPHCGPVVPVPYETDHDDPAAPGDRCPACGYDWPGGALCVG
jgi:hypothetical protein